ncbi:sulfotransferase [bacterium]|nr:sulfotransferase [bacterium]
MKNRDIDEIYYLCKYGAPKRKADIFHLRREGFPIQNMTFFLSTGRCGTAWFTKLLQENKNVRVLHNPKPSLHVQGKIVYEILNKNEFKIDQDSESLIREIYLAGREEVLRYVYKSDKIFVETNNHITFFAPVLATLFPQARFVHLYRHPGEFIRSGLRRGYYSPNDKMIEKRIKPVTGDPGIWELYSQYEKIAWLWNETNQFIEIFKRSIPKTRVYDFNFNHLEVQNIKNLFQWLEIRIHDKSIRKYKNLKINAQPSECIGKFSEWSREEVQKIDNICSKLSEKYQYRLKL